MPNMAIEIIMIISMSSSIIADSKDIGPNDFNDENETHFSGNINTICQMT